MENKNSRAGNNNQSAKSDEDNRIIADRKRKLAEIRELGINPYPYKYDQTDFSADIKDKFKALKPEESGSNVSIAGRIMTIRRMGKASFFNIQDFKGNIQVYIRRDDVGDDSYKLFKKVDIGDFLGVKGYVFKTKTGEITVYAKEIVLLTKSLRPLPEKFHGLKDMELRYRKRYLDLIMNPEVKDTFIVRSKIIAGIRKFLDNRGYIEVETPILQPIYGGANARPFKTRHNALNMQLYLKISPELYLKRLIVGGFNKVYDLNKNFRNEGIDQSHNPEFTMLEWYEAYADYNDMMDMAESLIKQVAKNVLGKTELEYKGHKIDISKKWKRIAMYDALRHYAKIDINSMSLDELKGLLSKHNIDVVGELTKGTIANALFEELVEDKLIEPTFITDYPVEISPLTKKHREKQGLVERFELFIFGKELANAYSELNDPIDQRERLEEQEKNRVIDEEAHPMDKDFVEAIEYGMPPTGGLGLGIDRLVMFLTGKESIKDVILFPLLKPKEE